MNLAKHHGLDLPEYDFEQVTLVRSRSLFDACQKALRCDSERLVRALPLYEEPPVDSLQLLIEITSAELARLAEVGEVDHCFTVVDDVRWGLSALPQRTDGARQLAIDTLYDIYSNDLVPSGHMLVADVPLVPHTSPGVDRQTGDRIERAVMRYEDETGRGGWYLNDTASFQWVPEATTNIPVFVDIEPNIAHK